MDAEPDFLAAVAAIGAKGPDTPARRASRWRKAVAGLPWSGRTIERLGLRSRRAGVALDIASHDALAAAGRRLGVVDDATFVVYGDAVAGLKSDGRGSWCWPCRPARCGAPKDLAALVAETGDELLSDDEVESRTADAGLRLEPFGRLVDGIAAATDWPTWMKGANHVPGRGRATATVATEWMSPVPDDALGRLVRDLVASAAREARVGPSWRRKDASPAAFHGGWERRPTEGTVAASPPPASMVLRATTVLEARSRLAAKLAGAGGDLELSGRFSDWTANLAA